MNWISQISHQSLHRIWGHHCKRIYYIFIPTRQLPVEMQCSKRCRIRLCSNSSKANGAFCSCVAWGWHIYNIVESESDPLTHRPVDLFGKEPLKGKWEVHLHTPTKFGEDPSKDLGGDREQTRKQTNVAWIMVWFCYDLTSMTVTSTHGSNPARVKLQWQCWWFWPCHAVYTMTVKV